MLWTCCDKQLGKGYEQILDMLRKYLESAQALCGHVRGSGGNVAGEATLLRGPLVLEPHQAGLHTATPPAHGRPGVQGVNDGRNSHTYL